MIEELQQELERRADPDKKAWWENYVKGASFRGVAMGDVRAVVRAWLADRPELSGRAAKALALELIRQPLAEDKLAGILILSEHLIGELGVKDLPAFRRLAQAHLDDWGSCDWFCVKVLGRMLERSAEREQIIEMLKKAYWMEIETVMSYIANSINPDGVRAQEIIESLEEDVQEELQHAQQFAQRIKELYGVVPGSLDFQAEQSYLQPPEQQTDIVHVIKGVIEAETGAIEHYNRIIEFTDEIDPVTNDMVIAILRDEEGHRRLFEGFLREYEAEGKT